MGARTDDNLKIIELKVSVNCCEGCKRKVLKALSIKGVLKTEIHPSQPKLTVYGSVDPQTLIKKLSRCGKTAELCSSEETKLPKIPATTTTAATVTAVDKEQQTKSYSDDAGGKQNSSLNDAKSSNNNNNNNKNKDGDEISNKVKETSGSVAAQVVPEEANTMFATPVVTTVPPMSYVVGPNPNMIHNPGSGGNVMASSHARVYYPMEPHTVLPMPYYTTVSTHCTAPPPPCYIPEHYQYEMPIYRTPPPPMQQQQPMGFSDYFNDDNTVGCHVM